MFQESFDFEPSGWGCSSSLNCCNIPMKCCGDSSSTGAKDYFGGGGSGGGGGGDTAGDTLSIHVSPDTFTNTIVGEVEACNQACLRGTTGPDEERSLPVHLTATSLRRDEQGIHAVRQAAIAEAAVSPARLLRGMFHKPLTSLCMSTFPKHFMRFSSGQ